MLFLQFLFFLIFFINNTTSLTSQTACYTGDRCNLILNLTDFSPNRHTLSPRCSLVNSSTCWVYGEVDYETRTINVTFAANSTFIDPSVRENLLLKNPNAITVLYYIVKVKMNPQRRARLAFFIECQILYKCASDELRHYWLRLTEFTEREKLLTRFNELLESGSSNDLNCFTNLNESSICPSATKTCFADQNSTRGCLRHPSESTPSWTFEYNVVRKPNILNHQVKRFSLKCSADRCNNNYTTAYLIYLSDQFAHHPPMRPLQRNDQPSLFISKPQMIFSFLLFFVVFR